MSDFEFILTCILIPTTFVLMYIAGKYDILSSICNILQEIGSKHDNKKKNIKIGYIMYKNDCDIGTVEKIIKHPKETFESINDIFDRLVETSNGTLKKHDLFLGYYFYDTRIGKDVYVVCCAKCGEENYLEMYNWPQYVCYVVEV